MLNYESVKIDESGEPLVDLQQYSFILEPAYFKQGLSRDPDMFLRKSVADKLSEIQRHLSPFRFKIWDGFRPREVQHAIYEKFLGELKKKHPEWDAERLEKETGVFVTNAKNPQRIPPHATGGAVDLTLAYFDGKELDMGTGFDYFGPEAASLYFENNKKNLTVRKNRKMLREAMQAGGFSIDKEEWWHFDFGNQKWALALNKQNAFYGEIRDNE